MTAYVQEDQGSMPCVVEHFFVYLVGRGIEERDQDELKAILTAWKSQGHGLQSLLNLLVGSEAFRMRQAPLKEEEN